jgi:hypothetical protein
VRVPAVAAAQPTPPALAASLVAVSAATAAVGLAVALGDRVVASPTT